LEGPWPGLWRGRSGSDRHEDHEGLATGHEDLEGFATKDTKISKALATKGTKISKALVTKGTKALKGFGHEGHDDLEGIGHEGRDGVVYSDVLITRVLLLLLLLGAAVAAQEPSEAANPLAALNEELQQVLAAANLPFTEEQSRAIALMMEDRRRASEELFGDLMDFRGGPTQGQQEDRLRSAIEWMRTEFTRNVVSYLTLEQAAAWEAFLASKAEPVVAAASSSEQTQFVRIHNNSFTAENGNFGSGGTEVVQRGGVGAWHGNAQLLVKDDALNARNAFAENEPPYQERRLTVDVSGPAIPGRLTTSFGLSSTEAKNVSTVRATLPEGIFALGITRPTTFRQLNSRSTLQLAEGHSLNVFARYATEKNENQNVGGFSLPERASTSEWRSWNAEIKQFSALSSQDLLEGRLNINRSTSQTTPQSEDVRINVLDAFSKGGAQNRSESAERNYNFDTMYTRAGARLTVKTGVEGSYRTDRTTSTNGFGGTFTFSSLDAFLAGTPLNYRETRGTPVIETDQLDASAFAQFDAALSSRFTLMLGVRYHAQTNLDDFNNVSPRLSFAWAPGQATVIRGGGGVYYNGLSIGMVENLRRFDGTRQYEVVIDNPSYPDPFAAGTLTTIFPSVRVAHPELMAPSVRVAMLSIERTFLSNLLVSASYNLQREFHRMRTRNLNAPFDATSPVLRSCQAGQASTTCVRPDPTRGNVLSLESSGNEVRHNLNVNVRKRFSLFNVSAGYYLERAYGDVQGGQGSDASDNYDLRADWGRAPFPLHGVDSTVNARLPLGIFLTGRMDFNSGRHYSVRTGFDDNRDGNVNDRPPGVPPNSLRGPTYLDFDFNISKAFFFQSGSSGPNVNVFINMTNAFNRVHRGTPSGVLTSPNFGRSTSASDPREIEAGLRFQF
jgi:hypothetical protein